jgi:hypothetical protein
MVVRFLHGRDEVCFALRTSQKHGHRAKGLSTATLGGLIYSKLTFYQYGDNIMRTKPSDKSDEPELKPEFLQSLKASEKEPAVRVKDFSKEFGIKKKRLKEKVRQV